MKSKFNKLLLLGCLALLPTSVLAQSDQSAASDNTELDSTDTSESLLLTAFADSELVDLVFAEDVNYRFILGSLQRTRGQVEPQNSERRRGNLTKLTYEVSQEFVGQDVYNHFLEQIQLRGYTSLFSCEGRACGSSNYWANDVFRNRVLYGPERNQFYVAIRAGLDPETSPHIGLYIITRSNRQIYAYMEIIDAEGVRPDLEVVREEVVEVEVANVDDAQGFNRVIRGTTFDAADRLLEAGDIAALAELMTQDSSLQVYLVAHLTGDASLEQLKERSLNRAEQLKAQLVAAGIDTVRISAQGLGPLAPICAQGNCEQRVEAIFHR